MRVGLFSNRRRITQFVETDLDIFYDVGAATGVGDIDQMNQQPGALNVAQELRAKACAGVRAFDQSGDVGYDEADFFLLFFVAFLTFDQDDAEVRLERGEGIIGDLRTGGRDARDQG